MESKFNIQEIDELINDITESEIDELLSNMQTEDVTASDVEVDEKEEIVTAEQMANERLTWGYSLVDQIVKRQKRFMITFSVIFISLLIIQYIYLVYKIETTEVILSNSIALVTQLIILAVETLGILGIITKYVFSNQTKEIVDGIYKHAYYHKKSNEESKSFNNTTTK